MLKSSTIMYHLEDSEFHRLLKTAMCNNIDTENITILLNNKQIKVNWENWDLTKEAIGLWIEAYQYNNSMVWRAWLLSKWIEELCSNGVNQISLNTIIDHKRLFQLFKPEQHLYKWPNSLIKLQNYIYDPIKKTRYDNDKAKDNWVWFYIHDECSNIADILEHPLHDLGDEAIQNIISRLPEPTSDILETKYIKLLTSYCDNMDSIITTQMFDNYKKEGISDDMIARLYLGYLMSTQSEWNIKLSVNLAQPVYAIFEKKRNVYFKLLASQPVENLHEIANKLNLSITTKKMLLNEVCKYIFQDIMDYYHNNPLVEQLTDMDNPEVWMSIYNNIQHNKLTVVDYTQGLPFIV